MKKLALVSVFVLITVGLHAQCAMCRATLENNLSNGDVGIAAGINIGILYLFFAPYVAVGTIAYFWYRASKANASKELSKRTALR